MTNGVEELEVTIRATLLDGSDYVVTHKLKPDARIELTRGVNFVYDELEHLTFGRPSNLVPDNNCRLKIDGEIIPCTD